MSEPEFTALEQAAINAGKDPRRVFTNALFRTLSYLIPSLGLVIYAITTGEHGYALVGYGILVFQEGRRLILTWQGLKRKQTIYEKYEAKLRDKNTGS